MATKSNSFNALKAARGKGFGSNPQDAGARSLRHPPTTAVKHPPASCQNVRLMDSRSGEIELKLTLPGADRRTIASRLAAIPPLAGTAFKQQRLRNIYFDTPEQHLRQRKAALRLRSVREGSSGRPRWLQTLKTAGSNSGGLSQRGEWETPLSKGVLDPLALQDTPWHTIDRNGHLLPQLSPCFETKSTRTLWEVNGINGSQIEVALDVGSIQSNGRSLPICELELELVQGTADALFALAEQIASHIAVLPAGTSKAEHGWRLVNGIDATPLHARTLQLEPRQPALCAAQQVLSEMLGQFTENLAHLLHSDDAELVHQARVGWRRWRSGLWLFKPVLEQRPGPDTTGLRSLLEALGAMRNLDVALLESLPIWKEAFTEGSARRSADWHAMETALRAEQGVRRATLLKALAAPSTGEALVRLGRWLHELQFAEPTGQRLDRWATKRTQQLHERLSRALDAMHAAQQHTGTGNATEARPIGTIGIAETMKHQHRVRLLAKRSRYCLAAMQAVLPSARTRRWTHQATELQTRIGSARDQMLLVELIQPLDVDPAVLGFLRGIAAAHSQKGHA